MNDREPVRPDELAALFGRWVPRPPAGCALAVSGGSDSLALMVLFNDWLSHSGQDAGLHTVLTVDHGLRSASAGEARAVAAQATALGFRHATLVWAGPKPRTGIQAAARTARYRLVRDYMRASGIALLLTGHTRDDQAETLLMRLARGSGLDGLSGMAPRVRFSDLGLGEPVPGEPEMVRPLTATPNGRLRATLEARGIAWIEDPSNQSLEFERPRLRAARAQLQGLGLTDAMLALSASRLQRARRALEGEVDRFCSEEGGAVAVNPCGHVTIDRARLQAAEEEITVRVLGRAIGAAGGSDEPVPLGNLEMIAAGVQGPEAEAAWTLARALVTATSRTLTVEREPGREALPVVELKRGEHALWDGRFWVCLAADAIAGAVHVRALGRAAARELGASAQHVPARVVSLVPSFWYEDKLIGVPPLGVWRSPYRRDSFRAEFVGCETIGGRQRRWEKPSEP